MYAIFCSQGMMGISSIREECPRDRFAPVLVMVIDGQSVVPCFHTPNTAVQFAKRNMPKEWLRKGWGTIKLELSFFQDDMLVLTQERKLNIITFDFPKRMGCPFDIEILECEDDPYQPAFLVVGRTPQGAILNS